jgi:hypothetical protein
MTLRRGADVPRVRDARFGTDLMQLWCILLDAHFPHRPACVHLRHVAVVHLDARAITKHSGAMARGYTHYNPQSNILFELYKRWRWAFDEFTWSRASRRPVCWTILDEERSGTPIEGGHHEAAGLTSAVGTDKPLSASFAEVTARQLRKVADAWAAGAKGE